MIAVDAVYLPVRALYDAVISHKNGSLWEQILLPWTRDNPKQARFLRAFGDRSGTPDAPIPAASGDELEYLYALSRVNQILLLRFQTGRADGTDWPGPEITGPEYAAFWEGLGLTVEPERPFSPFYHEIVEVEQSDDENEPPTLIGTHWPALTLGPLLFSRAGACVTGGEQHLVKGIAESSTLYWAYRRKNRPYDDLSHGWGSNSQWRTDFRRDYRLNGKFWYNIDGASVRGGANAEVACNLTHVSAAYVLDDLTRDERIELLTHRCFVRCPKPVGDAWIYDDTYSEAY